MDLALHLECWSTGCGAAAISKRVASRVGWGYIYIYSLYMIYMLYLPCYIYVVYVYIYIMIYGPCRVYSVLENRMRGRVRIENGGILRGEGYTYIFIIYDI